MIRAILSEIAATSWRDWLVVAAEFVGVCIVVGSIALICVGFAPDVQP